MWHENSCSIFLCTAFLETALFHTAYASGLNCLTPSIPAFSSSNSNSVPAYSAVTHLRPDLKACVRARPHVCACRCRSEMSGGGHKVRCKGKRRRQRRSGAQVEGLWFVLWGFEREINLCLRKSEAPMSPCVPQIDLEKWMLSSEREEEGKGGAWRRREVRGGIVGWTREEDRKLGEKKWERLLADFWNGGQISGKTLAADVHGLGKKLFG